jgi:hypothetical protein
MQVAQHASVAADVYQGIPSETEFILIQPFTRCKLHHETSGFFIHVSKLGSTCGSFGQVISVQSESFRNVSTVRDSVNSLQLCLCKLFSLSHPHLAAVHA